MYTEIEAKFLDVDHDDIRERLKAAGAALLHPMRMMRRALLDYPDMRLNDEREGFIRVRDEGDKVTLAYKEHKPAGENSVDGAKEIEVVVNDFEQTVSLLESIGFVVKSYQESKRETWNHGDCEVVLDEWPWLKPYIEIEGQSEEAVRTAGEDLGFEWAKAVFGGVTAAFAVEYPGIKPKENLGDVGEVKFGEPLPQWLKDRMQA